MKNFRNLLIVAAICSSTVIRAQISDKPVALSDSDIQESRCQCAEIVISDSQEGISYTVQNSNGENVSETKMGNGGDISIKTSPVYSDDNYGVMASVLDKSLWLDGDSAYVEIISMIPYPDNFSIVADIRKCSRNGLIYGWTSPSISNYAMFQVYHDKLRFVTSTSNQDRIYIDSEMILPDSVWMQVAVVCNNNEYILYVDGVEVKRHYTETRPSPDKSFIGGGYINNSLQNFFHGNIDNLSVWDIPLNQSEITALEQNNPTGNEPGLLAYYSFDNLPDTTLTNKAGAGLYNGSMYHVPGKSYEIRDTLAEMMLSGTVDVNLQANNIVDDAEVGFCPGDTLRISISETNNGAHYYLFDTNNEENEIAGPVKAYGNEVIFELVGDNQNQEYQVGTKSHMNQAVSFNGISDFFETEPMIPLTPELTVMARIKTTADGAIFAWGEGGVSRMVSMEVYFGKLRARIGRGNDKQVYVDGTTLINDDQWHNVALTLDGSFANIYINGELEASEKYYHVPMPDRSTIGAGFINNIMQSLFRGAIDDLSVWSKVLTENEMECYMYNNPWGGDEGLTAYYNFDMLSDTVLYNIASDNYHGTFNNLDSLSLYNHEIPYDQKWFEPIVSTVMNDDCSPNLVNENRKSDLKIYPNPANNYIHIEKNNKSVFEWGIKIYSFDGKLMFSKQGIKCQQFEVDLSGFSGGVYFIELHDKMGVVSRKFLKKYQ